MKRLFFIMFFSLALGHSGMSQSDDAFKFGLAAYNTAVITDTITTIQLLNRGGFREANPLLRPFQDDPLKLAGVKLGLAVASTYGLMKLREHRPKLAFWVTIAAVGLNSFAAAHNARKY